MKKQDPIFSQWLIFILSIFIIIFFILSSLPLSWNESIDNSFVDLLFKIRGSRQLSEDIVLVYIDNNDIQALGGWPITRDYYWYATYMLEVLGAKVIAFDISFDQPNRIYPEFDNSLAEIFKATGKVCLPFVFSNLISAENGPTTLVRGTLPTYPIKKLSDHAAGLGFSNLGNEAIIRYVPIFAQTDSRFSPSFGNKMAQLFLGEPDSIEVYQNKIIIKDCSGKTSLIPVNPSGKMRLNHFGGLNDLQAISFVNLLQSFEPKADSLYFKNKLVLLAVIDPKIAKIVVTPLDNSLPASLIHATVAENIIQKNYLREVPPALEYFIFLLLVALIWFAWRSDKFLLIVFGSFFIMSGYWIFSILFFSYANLIFPLFYPTLFFVMINLTFGLNKTLAAQQKQEAIKKILRQKIVHKQQQINEAKNKLFELQQLLQRETTKSENTQQLAEQQQVEIAKLEKELSDLHASAPSIRRAPEIKFSDIVFAAGSKMEQVLDLVAKVGTNDIPVLITGETGTGKEVIARAIHQSSHRKEKLFVAINCGSLPETLLDSELFGHEKGAFTGAQAPRRGRFELADGGTVFLDEITETTPTFQIRLLRVLQEGAFERLGSEETRQVDVRILAATNKDLPAELTNRRFRIDLFYRLNGFLIQLPPLRERLDDVPLLAAHFLKKYHYPPTMTFSNRVRDIFNNYEWPGNVRELENVVRRAALLAQSEGRKIIREIDLPDELSKQEIKLNYLPLEDQILEKMRSLKFAHAAISLTAKALGNRDRGTVTEYFRGICFEQVVKANFDIDKAAREIAAVDDELIINKVKAKVADYISNLRVSRELYEKEGTASPAFKGLPKKYYLYLEKIMGSFEH